MKNRIYSIGIAGTIFFTVLIFIFFWYVEGKEKNRRNEPIKIGVSLYRFDDTFIYGLKKEIEDYVKEYEKANKVRINLEISDAAGSQIIQNKQIDRFISLNYDVLLINPVDRADASTVIDKAIKAEIPVVFFNREPVEDDMNRDKSLFYVGSDPKDSAVLEGSILVEEYKRDKRSLDLNGDGFVAYLLLEGEPSHQDSLVRTEWSTKTLKDGGVPIIKLAGGVANWDRNQAAALMESWIDKYGDEIELVLSNNDDMALGAIDALFSRGKTCDIKVVGIDGTEEALEALKEGKLLGTVANDRMEYARALIEIAISKHLGVKPPEDISQKIQKEKYYYTGQYSVTKQKKE